MNGADKQFEAEVSANKKLIDDSNKMGMKDEKALGKLGVLMAVKTALADPKIPANRASLILKNSVEKYSKTENDDGRIYFWIKRDDGSYDAYPHDHEQLIRFVIRAYYKLYDEPLSRPAATQAIGAHTANGDMPSNIIRYTGKRVIKAKNNTIWIDLRDNENSIYKITPDYCGPTEPYGPDLGILFDREGGYGSEMPMPQRKEGDWLSWFVKMLRIPKDRHMLFKTQLCHMFCIWQETPFMMFSGPEGSGKTITAAMVKELVDPIGMNSTSNSLPKDETKLAMMLTKEQTQLFDNISYITSEVSDMLCQACTGGTHRIRELYTSNNMMTIPFRKMRILFTGISKTTIQAPDLASRILHYEVTPSQQPKAKSDLEIDYLEKRPHILYAVLETVGKALKEYSVNNERYAKLKPKTRMADFERFGTAIACVLGDREGNAIKQYQTIMSDDMAMMVADEPLIRLTEKILAENHGTYIELTNTFFAKIRELASVDETIDDKGKSFPKSPTTLRRQIDRLTGAFMERGIHIKIKRVHDKTAIVRQASHIIIETTPKWKENQNDNATSNDTPNNTPTDIPTDTNVQTDVVSSDADNSNQDGSEQDGSEQDVSEQNGSDQDSSESESASVSSATIRSVWADE